MLLSFPVVLASASPRRRELLTELIPEFEVMPADVDEDRYTVSDPWQTARELARAKAEVVALHRPSAIVIGSDTVVAIGVEAEGYVQLAKPQDSADAGRMLKLLSGRGHIVITGVALVVKGRVSVGQETTTVRFRELSDLEIRDYVATGESMDKAGAYAIQGGAGGFVYNTEGSISNVIGLPMELLRSMLEEAQGLAIE